MDVKLYGHSLTAWKERPAEATRRFSHSHTRWVRGARSHVTLLPGTWLTAELIRRTQSRFKLSLLMSWFVAVPLMLRNKVEPSRPWHLGIFHFTLVLLGVSQNEVIPKRRYGHTAKPVGNKIYLRVSPIDVQKQP